MKIMATGLIILIVLVMLGVLGAVIGRILRGGGGGEQKETKRYMVVKCPMCGKEHKENAQQYESNTYLPDQEQEVLIPPSS